MLLEVLLYEARIHMVSRQQQKNIFLQDIPYGHLTEQEINVILHYGN